MDASRSYGHDDGDEIETLAEAERQEDGTVSFRVVQIEHEAHEPTDP